MKQAVKSITEQICTPSLKIATYVLAVMLASTAGATPQVFNADHELTADDVAAAGSDSITQTSGTLSVGMDPLQNYTGRLVIENASVAGLFTLHGSSESDKRLYGFGEKTTLELSNATVTKVSADSNGTNNDSLPAIEVSASTGNKINNANARSQNGCNLSFPKSISGNGSLEIYSEDRWVKFSGNNAGFSGNLIISGKTKNNSSPGTWFENADAGGEDMYFIHTRSGYNGNACRIYLNHDTGTTIKFGAFEAVADTEIDVVKGGAKLEVGARTGTDSRIDVPFLTNAIQVDKVGSTKLTFGPNVSMIEGSTVNVKGGTLSVGSQNVLDKVSLYAGASLALNFTDPSTDGSGLSIDSISLPAGVVVTNEVSFTSDPADGSTYTLVTSDTALSLDDFALAITSTGSNRVAGELSLSQDGKSLLLTVATYPATPHLWVSFTSGDSSCKGSVGFSGVWSPDSDVPNAADYASGHEGTSGAYLPNGGKNGTSGRYPRAKHSSYTGPSSFTLFFAARSVDTENAVLLHLGYFNNAHRGHVLLRSGGAGKVKLSTMDTQNDTPVDAVVANVPSASLLTHVYAVVYDFPAKALKLYVDGEYAGAASNFGDPGTGLMPDGTTVYSGGISASDFRFGYTGGNKFTRAPGMLVDDFRCYEKMVLSDMAIKAISSELGPWADGLKYGYESDSTTGVTTFVIDDAAQGNSEVMLIKGVDTADFTLSHFAAKVSNRNGYKAKLRMENGNLVAKVSPTAFVVVVR